MSRLAGHALAVLLLTALSLVGGLAWLLALRFRRRWLAFAAIYAGLWLALPLAASVAGRQPLPCTGAPLKAHVLSCALNRHYVTPPLHALATDLAAEMDRRFPGTVTLALDAGFPFGPLPLLPHLSHRDGRSLDLAYFYTDSEGTYLPGGTRSPIGYFAFEQGPTDCPGAFPTLRWDLLWLQGLFPDRPLDAARTRAMVQALAAEPRLRRMFLEPHLASRLGVASPLIRFQGCRAARHDDHLHIDAS